MKKWLAAMALAAALGMGGAAQADDLHLPDGTVMPLGAGVTVWNGSDSYFSKKVNEWLADPELARALAQDFIRIGVYQESERKEAESMAEAVMQCAERSKTYQIRSVHGNTMYTAYVLSVPADLPLSAEDVSRWEDAARKYSEKVKGTVEETGHGELAESVRIAMETAGMTERKQGTSKHGVSYETSKVYAAPETRGWAVPAFVYALGTTKDQKLTVTIFWTDQASGRYFEPVLEKGTEALQ